MNTGDVDIEVAESVVDEGVIAALYAFKAPRTTCLSKTKFSPSYLQQEIINIITSQVSSTKTEKEGINDTYVTLGVLSATNLPTPLKPLYPWPPILLRHVSASFTDCVVTKTFKPDERICNEGRRDVSPDERVEDIA